MIPIHELYKIFLSCDAIVIDTKKIVSNSIFFALKGARFDANTFTKEALSLGAGYVVIDNMEFYIDHRTIYVQDVLKALQELATYHRDHLKCPIIALTGSNGKTTSKELISIVLSKKYRVKATVGNLNNHIGVPLTLLSFNQDTEIGIVEMGANHQKEIEFLCQIAKPDFGYITNFGKAHLEGFGGVEGVILGKSEMYHYLRANNKSVFINLDDPIQVNKTSGLVQIAFSQYNESAATLITKCLANPLVQLDFDNQTIYSHLIGLYNVTNIGIAITIGQHFGVSSRQIKEAIESYVPENNRSQLINKNSNKIILDAYNANPSSMLLALENFMQIKTANKVLILGDMFELGTESYTEHQLIVDYVFNQPDIICFFIGTAFYQCKKESTTIQFYSSFTDFTQYLEHNALLNSTILIKGSRGIALERALDFL